MTQGCVMTLPRGHISKVKVRMHVYPKFVSAWSRSYIVSHNLQGQGHSSHIPKICFRAKLLIALLDQDNISHNCFPLPKGVSWPSSNGHSNVYPRSRSQCTHTRKPFPGHNSLLSSWILIILHTIVVHDPRGCHDLDPRSYLQVEGHSTHITKIPCHTYNHG